MRVIARTPEARSKARKLKQVLLKGGVPLWTDVREKDEGLRLGVAPTPLLGDSGLEVVPRNIQQRAEASRIEGRIIADKLVVGQLNLVNWLVDRQQPPVAVGDQAPRRVLLDLLVAHPVGPPTPFRTRHLKVERLADQEQRHEDEDHADGDGTGAEAFVHGAEQVVAVVGLTVQRSEEVLAFLPSSCLRQWARSRVRGVVIGS